MQMRTAATALIAVSLGILLFHFASGRSSQGTPLTTSLSYSPTAPAVTTEAKPQPQAAASEGAPNAEPMPSEAVAELSPDQLQFRLENLLHDESPEASEMRNALLRAWAERDVIAAARWVELLPESDFHGEAVKQVAIAWADQDLETALEWVTGLPESQDKDAALVSVGYEAARAEPARALSLMGGLPPSAERNGLLVHAVSQLATADPNSAISYVEKVEEPELREEMMTGIAVGIAEEDGSVAATLATTEIRPGEQQHRSVDRPALGATRTGSSRGVGEQVPAIGDPQGGGGKPDAVMGAE
jgi:hypothetical protein